MPLLSEQLAVTHYAFAPGSTDSVEVAWVDMSIFDRLMATFFRTVGTDDLTIDVYGSEAADGSNSVLVKTRDLTGVQPDNPGDWTVIEVSADEIVSVDDSLRYVSVVASVSDSAGEGIITYVRGGARYKYAGLTSDYLPGLVMGVLAVDDEADTTVDLVWLASVGGDPPYTYQVQIAADVAGAPGAFSDDGVPQSELTYQATSLTPETPYWFRVVVTDDNGDTATSNEVTTTTDAA